MNRAEGAAASAHSSKMSGDVCRSGNAGGAFGFVIMRFLWKKAMGNQTDVGVRT